MIYKSDEEMNSLQIIQFILKADHWQGNGNLKLMIMGKISMKIKAITIKLTLWKRLWPLEN